jgi:hypothetical protein
MTVKMVVPTAGSFVLSVGVRSVIDCVVMVVAINLS